MMPAMLSLTIHASFIEVYGLGILLQGPAGIGKTDCVLELMRRGHKCVAGDAVVVRQDTDKNGVSFLKGMSSLHLGTHVSVRGVGVIDVAEIFDRDLILESRSLDLVLDLKPACATDSVEVLGVDEKSIEILGVRLPLVELPVTGQRPLATLVEVIARNENLKKQNVFMAKKFAG